MDILVRSIIIRLQKGFMSSTDINTGKRDFGKSDDVSSIFLDPSNFFQHQKCCLQWNLI